MTSYDSLAALRARTRVMSAARPESRGQVCPPLWARV